MPLNFPERLRIVLKKGNLRVADAAKIFDRPHPTVNGWVKRGLNPGGGPTDVDDAYIMLGKLESFLQRSKLLPVPTKLSPPQRIRYVKKLRVVLLGGKR
jgi:hypothetical protein